jgi:glycerol-3-phosphate dehydrogenase
LSKLSKPLSSQCSPSLPPGHFDIAVIGAGVVGCAVARRFALEGARVIVLEKAADILDGASKGNSAILHTGFDAPPDSLEQQCIEDGYREYLSLHADLGLPILKTGALVLAWSDQEAEKLDGLIAKARQNGVEDVEPLSHQAIAAREPSLSDDHCGGFLVPREYVIDPWTTPYVYMLQAIRSGATLSRATEVQGGSFEAKQWKLQTSRGTVSCSGVINCAGLFGDLLDKNLLGQASFDIQPRKGQFVVYDKAASRLLSSIVLPVPTEATKGIVVCPTIFGNVLVGPTAEEQESRDDTSVRSETLFALQREGERILPALWSCLVTATYSGIRPATGSKDYCIDFLPEQNYCTVGGIRSTGLSSALGIASHVFRLFSDGDRHYAPLETTTPPDVIPIAEQADRDWRRPGNGGIVCHCEKVTRREIERALTGPLAAASLAGLKRRTRATMGPCQGFFCSAELSEITAGRFANPLGLKQDSNG